MDQKQIGQFIASRRKNEGLTQVQLAERLGITDRAVSKWETGRSLPDPSIMLELCGLLNINVNELLTGEKLDMENYKENAENNLLRLLLDRKKLFAIRSIGELLTICGIVTFLGFPDILDVNLTQEIVMRSMGVFIFGCGSTVSYFAQKFFKDGSH